MIIFDHIVEFLSMSDEEKAGLQAEFEELRAFLQNSLPGIRAVRPFGSFYRGTRLSERINPTGDIDCMLVQLAHVHKEMYGGVYEFAEWAKDIQSRLLQLQHLSPYRVEGKPPFLTVSSAQRSFDLVLAVCIEEDLNGYHMISQQDVEEISDEDMDRYIGNSATYEKHRIHFQHPDLYDFAWLNARFSSYWRDLIVVLKFWRHVARAPVTSWMIEYNVLERLHEDEWVPEGDQTRLRFIASYLRDKQNYHATLLDKQPYFTDFTEALIRASDAQDEGDSEFALEILKEIFFITDELIEEFIAVELRRRGE